MGRFALSYGVNRLGGAAADYLEAGGNSGAKTAMSFASNIGAGALAGAAFGPAGIAIGAGIGAATSALEYWTDSIKKSQAEIEGFNAALKTAQQLQVAESKYLENREENKKVKNAVKENDLATVQGMKEEEQKKNDQLTDEIKNIKPEDLLKEQKALEEEKKGLKLTTTKIVPGGSSVTGYQQTYTEENPEGVKRNAEIVARQEEISKLLEKRKTSLQELQESDAKIAKLEAAEEQIQANIKAEEEKKAREEERRRKEEERQAKEAEQKKKAEDDARKRINDAIQDQLNADAMQKEEEDTRKLLESGDLSAINKRGEQLRKQADTSEKYYKDLLKQAENETDIEKKQELFKQAIDNRNDWQSKRQQLSGIDDFKKDIASQIAGRIDEANRAPIDTSLNDFSASYKAGMGIGEVGIDASSIEKEQLDTQKQIANFLKGIQDRQNRQTEVMRTMNQMGVLQ